MKTNRILAIFATALFVLPLQSCLKEMDDVFDKSSSARVSGYDKEVAKILSQDGGEWIMHYYAGTDYKYGGYDYYLKFTETKVTAAFELDTTRTFTSLYTMSKDAGATLVFDTYNTALHYFATPSSGAYQAMQGDFGFLIMGYDKDRIELRAKKTGNRCILERADGTTTALKYVRAIREITDSYRATVFEGDVFGEKVTGTVNTNSRKITFNCVSDTLTTSFSFTPDGLEFLNPVKVNGCTIDKLWYVVNNNLLTNGVVTFTGKLPEGWKSYETFIGNFTLSYNSGNKADISIAANEKGDAYVMSGLIKGYDLKMGYDKALGRLTLNSQAVAVSGVNNIYFCAWDLKSGGTLTRLEDAGVSFYWSEENSCFKMEDNGAWSDHQTDSFILYNFDTKNIYSDLGNARWQYIESLTKK